MDDFRSSTFMVCSYAGGSTDYLLEMIYDLSLHAILGLQTLFFLGKI